MGAGPAEPSPGQALSAPGLCSGPERERGRLWSPPSSAFPSSDHQKHVAEGFTWEGSGPRSGPQSEPRPAADRPGAGTWGEGGLERHGREKGEPRDSRGSPVERPRRTGCRTAGGARGLHAAQLLRAPRAGENSRLRPRPRARAAKSRVSRSRTPLGARGSAGRSRLQRRSPPGLGSAPAPHLPSLTRPAPPKAVGPASTSRSCGGPARKSRESSVKTRRARTATPAPLAAPAAPPPSARSAASAGTQPDTPHAPARSGMRGRRSSRLSSQRPCSRLRPLPRQRVPHQPRRACGDTQRSGVFRSETPGPRGTRSVAGAVARANGQAHGARLSPSVDPVRVSCGEARRETRPARAARTVRPRDRQSRAQLPGALSSPDAASPRRRPDRNAASSSSHAPRTPTGSSRPGTSPRRRGRAKLGERVRSGGGSERTSPRRIPGLGSDRRALTPGAPRALKWLRRNGARNPVRANSGTTSRFLGGDVRPEPPGGAGRCRSRQRAKRDPRTTESGPEGQRRRESPTSIRVSPTKSGTAQSRGGCASPHPDPPRRLFLETRGRSRAPRLSGASRGRTKRLGQKAERTPAPSRPHNIRALGAFRQQSAAVRKTRLGRDPPGPGAPAVSRGARGRGGAGRRSQGLRAGLSEAGSAAEAGGPGGVQAPRKTAPAPPKNPPAQRAPRPGDPGHRTPPHPPGPAAQPRLAPPLALLPLQPQLAKARQDWGLGLEICRRHSPPADDGQHGTPKIFNPAVKTSGKFSKFSRI
ncbi:collagen alpha-1(I) chain-like [Neovison vison]|uniref:collagen alpha-1(I) chain-like n=1 Tax=Neovison vison TaxID=452646 RepID=UPI001CF0738A|nr:collagen alpha-1(I) chain-like [Neogale vison]